MTKKEIRIVMRRNGDPMHMKGFYRILILWFILLSLCILWVHIDHAKADENFLLFSELRPTDEEINQKRLQLASVRDTLTDTDCSEIDEELDAWLDATQKMQDARADEDNRIVAYMEQRAADYEVEKNDRKLDEIAAYQDLATNHQR